jgi:hypothetical protein
MSAQATQTRRVEETSSPNCGSADCDNRGAKKVRGTWFCREHLQKFKSIQRTRTPDATPGPDIIGHAREWGDDAILGCGPHQLPDGRNY